MATELGKAYVQIIPSAKGISGMIQKEMGGEVASPLGFAPDTSPKSVTTQPGRVDVLKPLMII